MRGSDRGAKNDDALRCSILERLQLLNAEPDLAFDRLTRVAARATGASVALITFVGADTQWIPSRVGWGWDTTSLPEAFCVCTLEHGQPLEVSDASVDARFRNNPLVTGPDEIRFYAGYPLFFEGVALGTLCVLDRHVRVLSAKERETLADLAAMTSDLIAQRNEHLLRTEHERRVAALGEALQGSEARLAEAQRVANMGSWELRPATGEALFSAGISRLIGQDTSAMRFRDFQALFRTPEWWLKVDLDQHVEFALDLVGNDGKTSWFSWVSKPMPLAAGGGTRIIGTLQDITAATLAHRQLRAVEQRFRLLWETTPDVVVMLDENSQIQFVNPAVHKMFGHSPESVVGQPLSMLQPARLRDAHRQGFKRYLDTGVRRLDWRAVEAVGLHADGHEIPIEISFSDMEWDGHRIFAACMRDISARKAGELRQNELALQLRNAQKMEAIGALAGGIAHDFNNVLAGILGNSALALEELGPGHEAHPYLAQIQSGGRRGRNLVKQIMSFARRQPQVLELCDLNGLIKDNVALLRSTLPANANLVLKLSTTDCRIGADPTQLGQVISNLVTNAWQALPGGCGVVEIGAEALTLDAQAATPLRLKVGPVAHLWVRDEGHGMDEATVARVFEPFFTTKPQGEGTGLGLAVVHGIVGAHGGNIVVESKPEQGSAFHLYLPISAAGTEVGPTETTNGPRRQGAGQHVLYVDDDETMIVLVERLLQKLGYRATVLGCSRTAWDAVARDPAAFDLVLSDFDMPGLTGLQLAERLLAIRPDLPIVISSGHVTDELRHRAHHLGIKALMQKQNTFEEIADVLAATFSEFANQRFTNR